MQNIFDSLFMMILDFICVILYLPNYLHTDLEEWSCYAEKTKKREFQGEWQTVDLDLKKLSEETYI